MTPEEQAALDRFAATSLRQIAEGVRLIGVSLAGAVNNAAALSKPGRRED